MIKAIFFDLDGTLLNSDKVITPKTKSALKQCREKGIKLFMATARSPIMDKMLSWGESELSLFEGGIYYNGGCIEVGGQKEYQFISDEVVHKSIDLVCEYDKVNIALQLEDEKHAFRYPLEPEGYKGWGVASEESLDLDSADEFKTVKILVFFANLIDSCIPIDDRLVAELRELCQNKAQFYLTDNRKTVQITGNSINKLKSIEKIRCKLGYEKDEIAVFGDDVNDIEMLSAFKYSFAMGNAEDYVKESANYITYDNNNDGIHHGINDILQLI